MQYLSTENLPHGQRMAFVHEFFGRHIGGVQLQLRGCDSARFDLQAMALPGGMTIGYGHFSAMHGARTRQLLQDGRNHFLLTIHGEDHEVAVNGKTPRQIKAGDITVIDEASRYDLWFGRPMAVHAIALDRQRLAALVPRLDMEALHVLPGATDSLKLLRAYVDAVLQNPPRSDKAGELVSRQIYELAAHSLEGLAGGPAAGNAPSIAAARLKVVQKDILDRLSDPGLRIDALAERQGVTPRYIQRLFEMKGTTFSDFVRDSRLDLAFGLLQGEDQALNTVAAIALGAGFSDISSFNRAFRKRFNATPSDVRAAALVSRPPRG